MEKSEILKLSSASLIRRFGEHLRARVPSDDAFEEDTEHQVVLVRKIEDSEFLEQPWYGHLRDLIARSYELGAFLAAQEFSDHVLLSVYDHLPHSERYIRNPGIQCGVRSVNHSGEFVIICYADYETRKVNKKYGSYSRFALHDMFTNFPFTTASMTIEGSHVTGLDLYGRSILAANCHLPLPVDARAIHAMLKRYEFD